MSTKTTIKRVALVAVAALGLGVVSSVAPATAIERTPSIISVASDGALRAGVAGSITTQVLDNEIDDVGLLLSKAAGF